MTATKWWEGDITVFDIESTDKDPETSRIVTSCIGRIDGTGKAVACWEVLVNPGVPISPGATEVHGITNEMAAYGEDPQEVLTRMVTTLERSLKFGTPVVAFNGRFDFTILDRECRRYGVTPLVDLMDGRLAPVLDPYVLDKAADQYRKGSRKLGDMCEHYGVALTDAHNASADALAAGRLTQALVREHRGLRTVSLDKLHRAQEIWARQQAISLERYLRRKEGDNTITCERDWPLVPFQEEEQV